MRVLFVCTGNICRSPTAEGVFRARVATAGLEGRIETDSAGTHAYHVGEPPDLRSQAAARQRGIELSNQRARRVEAGDFDGFDLIVAMDSSHFDNLRHQAPENAAHKVRLFLDFAPELGLRDVPDPYYGNGDGFERVLDMIEAAAEGLLDHARARLGAG